MVELLEAMTSFGLVLDGPPVLDGRIHRCRVAGKRGRPGFYVGNTAPDGNVYAHYGSWTDRSLDQRWTSNGASSTKAREYFAALARKAMEERALARKRAAKKAAALWNRAVEPDPSHPYLAAKRVEAHGIRQTGDALVIPVIDDAGAVVSLQFIRPDGRKRFLKDGRKKGCCFPINGREETIYIAEGYATGATIHELTGCKVLVAFDAGNLTPVAEAARRMFPVARIIIAADNDHKTDGNPGLTAARKAAQAVSAKVVVPECQGTDFNDMAAERGPAATRAALTGRPAVSIVTAEDLAANTLTLKIPDDIMDPGGLISVGMEACAAPGLPGIPQYSLPVVLTSIARAISGKLVLDGVWPNLYNLKVGPTSTGKSSADRAIILATMEANLGLDDFWGPSNIASGQAMLRMLASTPHTLLVLDEVSSLFRRLGSSDPFAAERLDLFMEIYSKTGQIYRRVYADEKRNIEIRFPCMSLIGNATTTIFDTIQSEDFETGAMQRFDFWCYDGPVPKRGVGSGANKVMETFVAGLAKLYHAKVGGNLHAVTRAPVSVSLEPEAREMVSALSDKIVEECNDQMDDGLRGILSRKYDLALKYAMVHHAAMIDPEAMAGAAIKPASIEYGIAIADMLAGWKIETLARRVTTGQFHKDCEVFKQAIGLVIRKGRRPTIRGLADRKREIKNWSPQYLEQVVSALVARGEIVTEEGRRGTVYLLAKELTN